MRVAEPFAFTYGDTGYSHAVLDTDLGKGNGQPSSINTLFVTKAFLETTLSNSQMSCDLPVQQEDSSFFISISMMTSRR